MDERQQSGEVVGLPSGKHEEPVSTDDRLFVHGLVLIMLLDQLMARCLLTPSDVAAIFDGVEAGVGAELQGREQDETTRRVARAVRLRCAEMRAMLPALRGV